MVGVGLSARDGMGHSGGLKACEATMKGAA